MPLLEDDVGNISLVTEDLIELNDTTKTEELYEPFVYRGHCMNHLMFPEMCSCPIDDKVMLVDGTTKAIPNPELRSNNNHTNNAVPITH